jgi:hypothetical protein
MHFNKLVLAAVSVVGIVSLTGCSAFSPYPVGSVYQGTQIPHYMDRAEMSGPPKPGDKFGESCATGILAIAAFGDASIDAAKKSAGITEVHTVDLHQTNILGIYTQGCTQVHGK